jgi:hypothetical protein
VTAGVAAVVLSLAVPGCAPRPRVERAIAARGGPLHALVRHLQEEVRVGFPGRWDVRTVLLVPDRYALTIATATETTHYLFDGTTMRAFIGLRPVAVERSRASALASHARFAAVVNLDVLRLPGVSVAPLPAAELPPGVAAGLAVVLADGARFRLGLDERDLLVWASGPLDLSPLGRTEVDARFDDFRTTDGLRLAYHAVYAAGGRPLLEERTLAACPNDRRVTPESFESPAFLPDCVR